VTHLGSFEGKPLQSVAQGDLDLGVLAGDDAADRGASAGDFQPVVERMRKVLGEKAKEVRVSDRLTESPACLVTDEDGMSANLGRLLRSAGQDVPNLPLILEINPDHPIVTRLNAETDDAQFADWSHILFDQAMLAEGGHLDDPAGFVKRLNELMLAMAGEPRSQIWTPGS
jgi:molecular chaperone HtpG